MRRIIKKGGTDYSREEHVGTGIPRAARAVSNATLAWYIFAENFLTRSSPSNFRLFNSSGVREGVAVLPSLTHVTLQTSSFGGAQGQLELPASTTNGAREIDSDLDSSF